MRSEKFQSGCRAVTGDVKRWGGGYWRLEMRLGLVWGYRDAFGVESGPECGGGGGDPPFKRFPGRGDGTQKVASQKWPDQMFPFVNFVFYRDGPFGLGMGMGMD